MHFVYLESCFNELIGHIVDNEKFFVPTVRFKSNIDFIVSWSFFNLNKQNFFKACNRLFCCKNTGLFNQIFIF